MLLLQIVQRKLRFFGHAIRHNGLEKVIIQGKVESTRGRGRPKRAWHSDVEEWLNCGLHEASQMAQNREQWRKSVKATAARFEPSD